MGTLTTVFDTETTGFLNKGTDVSKQPFVVQLAAVQYLDRRPIAHLSAVILHEGITIPGQSAAIHKITTEIMNECGTSAICTFDTFNRMLISSDVLVAHNMSFDDPVMQAAFGKLGMSRHIKNLAEIEKHCTMNSSIEIVQKPGRYAGYGWPKLIELYEHLFGKQFSGAHDAMVDVRACARCYFELLDRGVNMKGGVR